MQNNKPKNNFNVNFKPIISLLIGLTFFSMILIVTLYSVSKDTKPTGRTKKIVSKEASSEENTVTDFGQYDSQMMAVIQEIDLLEKEITLFNVETRETTELSYSGGSNITDKYGQVITMGQLSVGTMVDVGYLKDIYKLIQMQISDKAWEYIGVNNLSIDPLSKIMKIASTKYKYTDELIILDGDEFVPVTHIAEQDELTIRGVGETIWSITITRGHGTVRLIDYEAFLGGNITVGYEAMQQITEDLSITVREGNFNLTVENGKYSGTKNITVERNKETLVSLNDLGPGALERGWVTFEITPFGADLFIDGQLTSYANPIELTYKEHKIEVALGGYTTYKGILIVDKEGVNIKIDLPEAESRDPAKVVETPQTNTQPEVEYNDWDVNLPQEGITQPDTEEEAYMIDDEHTIFVQNPIGASVYLNGDFLGISPGRFPKIIGSHVITFIKDGYVTQSYTIEVADDGLDTYISMPDLENIE
ncbi:PEGA domain-containing protein [Mobilitalea sibirica]|uniref:PEGA domain-containing protein n=1 Tax=Mobilitalea sibirica TaxID=1462919 RepID=A0A8J7H3U4_9FIRM|nr:PEGA domain-containing protein [Mobilitalea sibirica]MBH1941882.1 PEGA domain-containing protein [Mobilitalea sibirica]